jgi:DtxR family manganese transport transcriptional regulator
MQKLLIACVDPSFCSFGYKVKIPINDEAPLVNRPILPHSWIGNSIADFLFPNFRLHSMPLSTDSARHQRRTRQQHAEERAQDYVEAIALLIETTGEARATDLAKSLGVTHVTVIRTIQRLQKLGLVTTQPYRSIFLTATGKRLAARAKARHEKIIAFLTALGVSPKTAAADAEGIEHHVSPETLAAIERFLTNRS